MAFAIIVEIPGGTRGQYDRVAEAMGLRFGEALPPGQVIHFAGPAAGSWIVIDVWDSREAYEAHVAERGEKGRRAVEESGLPPYSHREFEVYQPREVESP